MSAEDDKATAKRRKLIRAGLLTLAIGGVGALVDYYWLGTDSDRFIAIFHLVFFTFLGLAVIGWAFLPPADNDDLDNDI